MSAPDLFALGGRRDPDAEILALFRQWLELCRVLDATQEDDEPAWNAASDRQLEIEERIFASRGGPIGLAVKMFLYLHNADGTWAPSVAQVRFDQDHDYRDWFTSMLRDAAVIVPEIGELAAAVIHDDAALIDADMARQWAEAVWPGEPGATDEWRRSVLETQRQALDRIASTPATTPQGAAIKATHAGAGPWKSW